MQYVSSHAISSIQLTQLVVLDGASKDAQSPSVTIFILLCLWIILQISIISECLAFSKMESKVLVNFWTIAEMGTWRVQELPSRLGWR